MARPTCNLLSSGFRHGFSTAAMLGWQGGKKGAWTSRQCRPLLLPIQTDTPPSSQVLMGDLTPPHLAPQHLAPLLASTLYNCHDTNDLTTKLIVRNALQTAGGFWAGAGAQFLSQKYDFFLCYTPPPPCTGLGLKPKKFFLLLQQI